MVYSPTVFGIGVAMEGQLGAWWVRTFFGIATTRFLPKGRVVWKRIGSLEVTWG